MVYRSERVCGGTFQATVANMLLRRYGRAIGLEPGFTILDRSDSEDLIALIRAQLSLNEKDKRFPRKGTIAEMFQQVGKHVATARRNRRRGVRSLF